MIFRSIFKRKKLHLLGDSHIGQLIGLKEYFPKIDFELCCVQGATASGLHNPHSSTLAGPIFQHYIENKIKHDDHVLVHLGEVDCGFLMWVKSERDNVAIEEQLDFAISNYQLLLEQIRRKTKHCIVLGVIPPTIKDGVKIGNVANLRGQIKATQLDRTLLTLEMNRRLCSFCFERNIGFIDLENALIDPNSHVVRDEFLNPNIEDHHLNPVSLVNLVRVHLEKTL